VHHSFTDTVDSTQFGHPRVGHVLKVMVFCDDGRAVIQQVTKRQLLSRYKTSEATKATGSSALKKKKKKTEFKQDLKDKDFEKDFQESLEN
jgi:hypothetical protein